METNKNTLHENLSAVNNAENSKVNSYAEAYKQQTQEILNNPNTTFSEFVEEQSVATDIARLWWLKPWALLKEQLTALWLYNKTVNNNVDFQEENNSIFKAPWKTVQLAWLAS